MSIVDYLRANEAKLKAMRQDGETWETIAALVQNETGEEVNLASLRKTYSRLFGGSEAPVKIVKPQKVSIKKVERKPKAETKAETSDDHFSGYETLTDEDILSAPLPPKSVAKVTSKPSQTDVSSEINLDALLSSESSDNEILELKKLLSERDAEIRNLISLRDENELDVKHPNYQNYLKSIINNLMKDNKEFITKNLKLENDLEETGLKKEIEQLEKALEHKDNLISEMQKGHEKRWKVDFKIAVAAEVNRQSAELHPTYQRRFQLYYDNKIRKEVEALEKKYKGEKKFLGVFAIN